MPSPLAVPQHGPLARFLRGPVRRKVSPLLQRWFHAWFSKPRDWRYGRLTLTIQPGVLPPHLTISTPVLLEYLTTPARSASLSALKALDMGCGSGAVALALADAGADVFASDINPLAARNTADNARANDLALPVVVADQIKSLRADAFDLIIITPPYYPKAPASAAEQAWFCGPRFEYFQALFPQVATLDLARTEVLMLLSEDCDIAHLTRLARQSGLAFHLVHAKRCWLEWTIIVQIRQPPPEDTDT